MSSAAAKLSGLELGGEAFAAIIHGFSERNLLAPRILERLERPHGPDVIAEVRYQQMETEPGGAVGLTMTLATMEGAEIR